MIKLRTLRKEKQKLNEKKSRIKLILTIFILLLIIITSITFIYKDLFFKFFNNYEFDIKKIFNNKTLNNISTSNNLNICKCMGSETIRDWVWIKYGEEQLKKINLINSCNNSDKRKSNNLEFDYPTLQKCETTISLKITSDFLICYRQNYNNLYLEEKKLRNLNC